jgi:Flp pilus assembly protein TadD
MTDLARREALISQAHGLIDQGHWEAIGALLDGIAIDESSVADAPLLSIRATWARRQGQGEAAMRDARRVAELMPADPIAHYNLAVSLERAGHLHEAVIAYRHSLALDPRHFSSLYNLGPILLVHQRAAAQALELYVTAYELNPDDPRLLINLPLALVTLDQHDRALTLLNRSVERGYGSAPLFCLRGLCNTELGNFDAGMADYDRALQLDPMQPQARYNRSLLTLLLGRMGEAWQDYEAREDLAGLAAYA